MYKKVNYDDAVNNRIFSDNVSKRVVVVMPAHNEAGSIGDTLDSISKLVTVKDTKLNLFVAYDNCTDNTEEVVKSYADRLDIFGMDTISNKDHKAGALNQVYQLFFGNHDTDAEDIGKQQKQCVSNIVAFMGIDADVYLDSNCLITLWTELQQKYKIAGVSANYLSLLPTSKYKESKSTSIINLKSNHGGALARFITAQQNKSFVQWTLEQKHNGYIASILGGQCTLFRPEALEEVNQRYKLNGVYSTETDTEDLLLTQQLRALGWVPRISESARCYVDSMKTMSAYINQQVKWSTGKLDYVTKAGVSTAYARKIWREELTIWMNIAIRVGLLILIPASLALNRFKWSWIWALPLALSMILNLIVSLKVPNKRFIDVLLSVTTISPEVQIWLDAYVHYHAWKNLAKVDKSDGWRMQELAEAGSLKSSHVGIIAVALLIIGIVLGVRFGWLSSATALDAISPYISSGFTVLTYLTLFTTFLMVVKLFKIRGNFKG
jgi:cellulose synthase/poly-beta-1,6-N-acetylglucosamine synthase-like glycosyltransferase